MNLKIRPKKPGQKNERGLIQGAVAMTSGLYVRLSGEPPVPPANADFSFTIKFEKGRGDPRRIFDSASSLIDGFEGIDEAVAGSIHSRVKPLMVLEDIEAGSLRVWLKTILENVDDEGLKQGEWKKALGPALVKMKYAAIGYLDKDNAAAKNDGIDPLREELRKIAAQTDVRHLPDYPPVHEGKLLAALDTLQGAKRLLGPNDKLQIEAPGHKAYEVDLNQVWEPSDIIPLSEDTTEKHSEGEIILTIRRPDMTGKSMWSFTRGKFPVSARILDQSWLELFHRRRVALFSNDAMRCVVRFSYIFSIDGTLIEEKIEIVKVLEIIRGASGEQFALDIENR